MNQFFKIQSIDITDLDQFFILNSLIKFPPVNEVLWDDFMTYSYYIVITLFFVSIAEEKHFCLKAYHMQNQNCPPEQLQQTHLTGLTQNPCNQHRVLLKNKTRSSHTHVREQVVIHTFITQKPGMDEELETCKPTHSCLIQCCHLSPFHPKQFVIVFLCMLTSMKTWTNNYTLHDISEGGHKYKRSISYREIILIKKFTMGN